MSLKALKSCLKVTFHEIPIPNRLPTSEFLLPTSEFCNFFCKPLSFLGLDDISVFWYSFLKSLEMEGNLSMLNRKFSVFINQH